MNTDVYPRQDDVSPFYAGASLVVNLSDPRRFVETFGLTALEAMSAGLPVVVPPVGGIAEMVEEGVNGYLRDVADLDAVAAAIDRALTDEPTYRGLSLGALDVARRYSASEMARQIESVIQ